MASTREYRNFTVFKSDRNFYSVVHSESGPLEERIDRILPRMSAMQSNNSGAEAPKSTAREPSYIGLINCNGGLQILATAKI